MYTHLRQCDDDYEIRLIGIKVLQKIGDEIKLCDL